jgi:TRAP-type uncharacterized transport system substrate-binding protein
MNQPIHAPSPLLRDRPAPRWIAMAAMLLASFGMVVLGGFLLVRTWKPKTLKLQMLTDKALNQALMGKQIAANGRRHGLEVNLSERPAGALEALELIDLPDGVDIALVAGGITQRDYPNVRQVTAMTSMPMHLLARPELAEGGLARLKGRRLNLGPTRTATQAVALDILDFAGFRAPREGISGDFQATTFSSAEIERKLAQVEVATGGDRAKLLSDLPDAFFNLTPMPSILARDLVNIAGYRLVPLLFAEAYCLDRISETPSGEVRVDRASLVSTDIPAYTYGIDPAVPLTPCRTVSTRLLLVARGTTPPEAISRLLETVYDGPVARLTDPMPLRGQVPLFPFHPGTEIYMRRNEPFLTPELLAGVGKAGGGLGALASGIVAFYGFLRLRQLRRFEAYYHEIRRIELIARGQEFDPVAPMAPEALRDYLEGRLLDLKSQVLKDFAEGGLKGEGLMAGIVALVNDTRTSLDRLGPTEVARAASYSGSHPHGARPEIR